GFLAGSSQTTAPLGGPGATSLYDQMPDGLTFANSYTVNHNNVCAAIPSGIVSRKVHGAAGPFDINLPAAGNPGIECRRSGTNNAYTLVYTFGTDLAFAGGATVTQGNATVDRTSVGPRLNQVTVNVSNVTNAQHLMVTLAGVQ